MSVLWQWRGVQWFKNHGTVFVSSAFWGHLEQCELDGSDTRGLRRSERLEWKVTFLNCWNVEDFTRRTIVRNDYEMNDISHDGLVAPLYHVDCRPEKYTTRRTIVFHTRRVRLYFAPHDVTCPRRSDARRGTPPCEISANDFSRRTVRGRWLDFSCAVSTREKSSRLSRREHGEYRFLKHNTIDFAIDFCISIFFFYCFRSKTLK